MIAAGLVLVLAVAGGLISIAGLGLMNSVGGRMAFALVGIGAPRRESIYHRLLFGVE